MGIYLQVPVDLGKADWLIEHAGAEPFSGETFEQVPEGKLLVIVAARPGFDVAAVIYDEKEWELKTRLGKEGDRSNRMLVIDRQRALELEPGARLAGELRPSQDRAGGDVPGGWSGLASRLRRR